MSAYEHDRYFCSPGTDTRIARIGPRRIEQPTEPDTDVTPCSPEDADVWAVECIGDDGETWDVVGDADDEQSAETFAELYVAAVTMTSALRVLRAHANEAFVDAPNSHLQAWRWQLTRIDMVLAAVGVTP